MSRLLSNKVISTLLNAGLESKNEAPSISGYNTLITSGLFEPEQDKRPKQKIKDEVTIPKKTKVVRYLLINTMKTVLKYQFSQLCLMFSMWLLGGNLPHPLMDRFGGGTSRAHGQNHGGGSCNGVSSGIDARAGGGALFVCHQTFPPVHLQAGGSG